MSSSEISQFPDRICDFAGTFVDLQRQRHDADYNPQATFTRSDTLSAIGRAEDAIKGL